MLWQIRLLLPLHQGHECLLKDIFSLAVAEAQGASIKDKLRRLRFVKGFAPPA
jgi:hypothetical protein